MASGHRYRLLIYFAALVLCLSVCFAYAESPATLNAPVSTPCAISATLPQAAISDLPIHLLFNAAPGRSSFMPSLSTTLVAQEAEAQEPVMTADAVLRDLTLQTSHPHGLLHSMFPSRHKLKLVKAHTADHLSAAVSNSPQLSGDDEQAAR